MAEAVRRVAAGFLLALAAFGGLEAAAASPVPPSPCREVSAPTVIRKPGCVRITADIATKNPAESALVVYADGVIVDLDGHTLRGAGPASTAPGIHALGGDNLTVRNGTIKGFLYGIRAESYFKDPINSVVIERITVDSGTARGIYARAERVLIHDSTVRNLSGFSPWPGSHTIAIEVVAASCWITDNKVSEIYPEGVGEGVGIAVSESAHQCHIAGNVLSNGRIPPAGRAIAVWISADQGAKSDEFLTVEGNRVTGFTYAFMAPVPAAHLVQRNEFEVNCIPNGLAAPRYGGDGNRFTHVGGECEDLPERLKVLAENGDANARIRLAAAYIEHQWMYGEELKLEEVCPQYALAKDLLDPLVRQSNEAAIQQMARLVPIMAACRGGGAR